MKKTSLGQYLKAARLKKGLSQGDVATLLRLKSAQSISDWERGYGSAIPVKALKKLIQFYGMNEDLVFKKFVVFQVERLEAKLRRVFYGRETKKPRR
jgi:transcriptional regulator with XRE-family HTH domain